MVFCFMDLTLSHGPSRETVLAVCSVSDTELGRYEDISLEDLEKVKLIVEGKIG